MRKILYIANVEKDQNLKLSNEIISFLLNIGCEVFVDKEEFRGFLNTKFVCTEELKNIELIVVLGGDGTILINAQKYKDFSIPIMGINMGRVGALAVTELYNYQENFRKYLNNDFEISNNLVLDGQINYANGKTDTFTIFNDIFVHRGSSTKMLKTSIAVNKSEFSEVYADGLVVSTPIGSSAYNLSAGGPLLSSNSNCYVITPICPQSRSVTSFVVSKDDETTLTIGKNINTAIDDNVIVIDGCVKYPLNANDVISICKSEKYLKLIQFSKRKFLYESVYKSVVSINKK